jgi:uncharacterized membrane protein
MKAGGHVLLAIPCTLVLAAIAHLCAVLAIPRLGEHDATSRLRGAGENGRSQTIETGRGATWPPHPDPAVSLAACAYDLRAGPMRISARTGALFESLSLHASGGTAFFAVTDRAAVKGALDLVIMTQAQYDAASAEDGDEPSPDLRVVAPSRQGAVVIRVLADLPSRREEADALARSVACSREAASPGG